MALLNGMRDVSEENEMKVKVLTINVDPICYLDNILKRSEKLKALEYVHLISKQHDHLRYIWESFDVSKFPKLKSIKITNS